jgi:hypothetical protein
MSDTDNIGLQRTQDQTQEMEIMPEECPENAADSVPDKFFLDRIYIS